jgi:hypothetical protein
VTEDQLPASNPNAVLLAPPIPVYPSGENNWPLLTVSKGLFGNAAFINQGGAGGEAAGALGAMAVDMDDAAAGAWGDDDDLMLDVC